MDGFQTEQAALTMDAPAVYRIRVAGLLDPGSSASVAGMQIARAGGRGAETQTVLIGLVVDQAALSGVLNTLYEMHYPVIAVELLEVGQ